MVYDGCLLLAELLKSALGLFHGGLTFFPHETSSRLCSQHKNEANGFQQIPYCRGNRYRLLCNKDLSTENSQYTFA